MKVTKRELLRRIEALEEWRDYADEMLTELNHALPDPEHDAKCAENAVAVEESLERHAVRLGLKKPKLKQLDQSVFDGLDEQWRFAAVSSKGYCCIFQDRPVLSDLLPGYWQVRGLFKLEGVGDNYDASNWQNSLIERSDIAKELAGSDLCRAMLERGDKYVLCFVSDFSDDRAVAQANMINLMTHIKGDCFYAKSARWKYAVPINQQTGEPLTAADVGL